MPKLKTHKSSAARFRITGGGKIMRMYGRRNNFRRKKRGAVNALFKRTVEVAKPNQKKIRRLLAGQA